MFYGNTYKNWETAQWRICHYDLFSQIVRLKKAMSKRTFFYFKCSIGHFTWRSAYVLLLQATQFSRKTNFVQNKYVYIVKSDVAQHHTQNALLFSHCKNCCPPRHSATLYVYYLSCTISLNLISYWSYGLRFYFPSDLLHSNTDPIGYIYFWFSHGR
jgi:hypothetical protein